MRRLRFTAEARADLLAILDYTTRETGSTAPARRVVDRIQAKCRKFASLPAMMGWPRPELRRDLRSFVVGRYVVFLRYIEGDLLEVVAVFEGHRDIEADFQPIE